MEEVLILRSALWRCVSKDGSTYSPLFALPNAFS